jgi:hypothetical protein
MIVRCLDVGQDAPGTPDLFVESSLLGDRGEDALHALLADPGQETLGHASAVGESRGRLEGLRSQSSRGTSAHGCKG